MQVNGKARGRIQVPVDVDQDTAQATAMDEPNVSKFLDGLTIRKVILFRRCSTWWPTDAP